MDAKDIKIGKIYRYREDMTAEVIHKFKNEVFALVKYRGTYIGHLYIGAGVLNEMSVL